MALYINTNSSSINAQRQLSKSTMVLGKTFQRLASGMRINSAQDDAAGLSIATRMTSQIMGLSQSMRNANDGISLAQVAEGALEETTNALQRIRELAVQSASDTNTPGDRDDLQLEVKQLISEIQRIANDTEFNTQAILNGQYESSKLVVQVGAKSGQTIEFSFNAMTLEGLGVNSGDFSIGGGNTQSGIMNAITVVDSALAQVSDLRSNLGAVQNRFQAVIANLSNVVENMSAAKSRIMDADIAAETATLTRNAILQQAGTAVLAQANQQPQLALQLLG